jgi:hypothetical protein
MHLKFKENLNSGNGKESVNDIKEGILIYMKYEIRTEWQFLESLASPKNPRPGKQQSKYDSSR